MPAQGYYGGYSLVRSSAHTTGGVGGTVVSSAHIHPPDTNDTSTTNNTSINNNNNNNNNTVSTTTLQDKTTSGLARMNFAACNSDWMPSLARASPAAGESVARKTILQAFVGMQNFYRGMPLRAVNNDTTNTNTNNINTNRVNVNNLGNQTKRAVVADTVVDGTPNNATTTVTTTTTTTTTMVTTTTTVTPIGMSKATETKRKLIPIPTPIGSDTWAAISDAALTTKSGVVAARRTLPRPVPPMAIGVSDADLELEVKSRIKGPEPLFRDLLSLSSPLESNSYTAFAYSTSNKPRKEPIPIDAMIDSKQEIVKQMQDQHKESKGEVLQQSRPIPPVPISTSPMLSVQRESDLEKEEVDKQEAGNLQYMRSDSQELFANEEQYVPQALLDEVNTGIGSRTTSPLRVQQENTQIPLFGGETAATRQNKLNGSLLREGDEEMRLFDDDEDEDALERIMRAINIVMSVATPENTAVDMDTSVKATKGMDFDMEWAKAKHQSQQENSFFHGI
ncbi:hypothetical protein LSM04_009705 [Trypanosoma melophagium]|uniref:uncharacterized protein n=1 Tax=Trypanosoma melophagium TaxID=715481 RepID=UPI00351A1266|nr:hypothetical protein LSM04_009705 [Trypanosoma melophagium]